MAEKKSNKSRSAKTEKQRQKLSEGMIIALIGLLGTIIVAILGSPLAERWLNPSPTATATSVLHLDEISVLKWNIGTTCSSRRAPSVRIYGLTISGGLPPYTFQFVNGNTTVSSQAVNLRNNVFPYEILFDNPITITVETDTYLDVSIKSNTIDGNPSWKDDLFFSSSAPDCTNTIP